MQFMPYKFSFDLSGIPNSFYAELARVASENKILRKFDTSTRRLAHDLATITGLEVPETLQLVDDLVSVYSRNLSERKRFEGTKSRALMLPHCSRRHMDSKCKAAFDPNIPTYVCGHCSEDCLINVATRLGKKNGYSVFVLPGGSCILSILKREKSEGIIGIACGQEVRLGSDILKQMGFAGQAIPLIRNGCANTSFSIETLKKTL